MSKNQSRGKGSGSGVFISRRLRNTGYSILIQLKILRVFGCLLSSFNTLCRDISGRRLKGQKKDKGKWKNKLKKDEKDKRERGMKDYKGRGKIDSIKRRVQNKSSSRSSSSSKLSIKLASQLGEDLFVNLNATFVI